MGFPKDLLLPFSRVSLNAAVVSFPDIIKTTTKSLVFFCVKLRREGFGEGGRKKKKEEGWGGGGFLVVTSNPNP
jgi:hypothetical protein